MQKNLLFTALAFLTVLQMGNAQTRATRTSVNNGNATNPLTWDCVCIPLPGDVIIINTAVTLDNDFAYSSGSVTVNAGASLTGDVPTRAFALTGGGFTNNGTMTIGNFYHGGGSYSNTGNFTVLNAYAADGTANSINSGSFNVNDTLYINTNAAVTNSGTVNTITTASAGTMTNTGLVNGIDLFNSGTLNNNGGSGFSLTNLYSSGHVYNYAKMHMTLDLWNSEVFMNTNEIVIDRNYWNGDTIAGTATFTNDGTISVGNNLNNSLTMNGSGDYCVQNATNNSGIVGGNLDVCDLTGGTGFDVNIGSIAGSVTFCSAGSCSIGIAEHSMFEHAVYPNPFNAVVNFETTANSVYTLNVINSVGETVFTTTFSGNRYAMDASGLTPGVYFYRLKGDKGVVNGSLVK